MSISRKNDIYSIIELNVNNFKPKIEKWCNTYFKHNSFNGNKPEIIVGTDSSSSKDKTVFTVAIVLNNKGFGGEYIYKNFKVHRKLSIFEKIYSEVHASLLVAQWLKNFEVSKQVSDIIVHIDVSSDERAKSSTYYQSLIGMVAGSGFCVVGKPFAYAATNVADRHCKS